MDYNELKESAENGDIESQFLLGKMFYERAPDVLGAEVHPDLKESLYWFERAAHSGHLKAQGNLGMMKLKGVGTAQNLEEGFYWLSKVAESGHAKSKFHVGLMMLVGQGTAKNVSKGLDLLYESANAGDVEAQMTIGSTFLEGNYVERDYGEALYWLK